MEAIKAKYYSPGKHTQGKGEIFFKHTRHYDRSYGNGAYNFKWILIQRGAEGNWKGSSVYIMTLLL